MTRHGGREMTDTLAELFSPAVLETLFPPDLTDRFFDALYGDARDGAYDIRLRFAGGDERQLLFEFHLQQRRGKCLACNLTYGLPEVFPRHPILNLKGLVARIEDLLGEGIVCSGWRLGATREISRALHVIPLVIEMKQA